MVGPRREPMMQALRGPIGLFYTALADVGGLYTFRFRLHTSFFRRREFTLSEQNEYGADTHSRVAGAVDLGFTFTKWTEAYVGVYTQANRNERADPNRVDPPVVFALGDATFGIKAAHKLANNAVGIGAVVGGTLLSGSDKLITQRANFNVDAVSTLDLRYLTASRAPVRLSANAGWMYDNSYDLVDFDRVDDAVSREVLRFSMGVNHSRVRLRVGADFPLRLGQQRQFGVDPIVEYSWNISTQEEQLFRELTALADGSPMPRSQSWVTVGLRANLYDGLHVSAAADIRTVSPNYEWGPAVAPWQAMLGLGWSFDPKPIVKEVEVEPTSLPEPVLDGRVVGHVLDAQGQPVPDARVSFPGLPVNTIVTDAAGSYASFRFPEGAVTVRVEVNGFEPVEQAVQIKPAKDTTLDVSLAAPLPPPEGTMQGMITDETGRGIAASVHIRGQGVDEPFTSTAAAGIAVALPVGPYTAVVSAPGFTPSEIMFEVTEAGYALAVSLTRAAPVETPNVSGSARGIRLRRGIAYRGLEVAERSLALLDELAVFLVGHPEFVAVEIRVHTDDRGNPRARSQARADAVMTYLISRGVAPQRLTAVGWGDRSPRAVNLTPQGRAQNNRTELRVVDYAAPPP
ncbi:MAG: OmpA family protein [Myxococcales bacterium FL481]|nr:MAG: OmpA family protein [Myxococcales bacterium FL481]